MENRIFKIGTYELFWLYGMVRLIHRMHLTKNVGSFISKVYFREILRNYFEHINIQNAPFWSITWKCHSMNVEHNLKDKQKQLEAV